MGDNGEGLRAEVVKMICASPNRDTPFIAVVPTPDDHTAWAKHVIEEAEVLIAYIKDGCDGDGACEGEA